MRLLGRGVVSRTSVWCSSAVEAPTAPARPRLRRRPQLHSQSAGNTPCSQPEPLVVCLPVLEGSGSSSSSSSSAAPWHWQLSYLDLPPQLRALSFVEVKEDVPHFSVQLGEPQPPQQQEKHKDYYANVGDCIRTLREDIPMLFVKDLNYAIYREDMVFKDQRVSFKGLKNYKTVIWSLRFHGNLFFKQPYVEVLRIWQPEDNLIKMRWAVHGRPRLWWTERGQFDGISTYKLDKNGQIYEHAIDNMQLRDPPITNPLLYAMNLISSPSLVPQQTPCPGAWYREEREDALPGGVMSAGQQ